MTCYVLTVHHRAADWIEVQHRALRRFLPDDTRIVASLEGIDDVAADRFDLVVPSLQGHAGKLNLLAWEACRLADDDDVLIFLDGDALPLRPLAPLIDDALGRASLAAVVREENGDCQPHPSFAFTTAGYWASIRGDWSTGHPWLNTLLDEPVTDVGGNLLRQLDVAGDPWLAIHRTRGLGEHPVFYGIYGDAVYHHGAAFRRRRITRADAPAGTATSTVAATGRRAARKVLTRVGRPTATRTDPEDDIGAQMYERICREWDTLVDPADPVAFGRP